MLLHNRYRHPSIAEGKQVLYAGEIYFNNGKLKWWSNGSGHYQPGRKTRRRPSCRWSVSTLTNKSSRVSTRARRTRQRLVTMGNVKHPDPLRLKRHTNPGMKCCPPQILQRAQPGQKFVPPARSCEERSAHSVKHPSRLPFIVRNQNRSSKNVHRIRRLFTNPDQDQMHQANRYRRG